MNKIFIDNVEIEGLFGYHNYYFRKLVEKVDFSNMIIIHGNNGSGKTHILKIISTVISSKPLDGSKSYLMNVPFTKVVVGLNTGVKITAYRSSELGSFTISLIDAKDKTFLSQYFEAQIDDADSGKFIAARNHDQKYLDFLLSLEDIGLRPLLITHERYTVESFRKNVSNTPSIENTILDLIDKNEDSPNKTRLLKTDKYLVETWIQNEIRKYTDLGAQNTNRLYLDLIRVLKSEVKISSDEINSEMTKLIDKVKKTIDIGLVADKEIKSFIEEVIELGLDSMEFEKISKTVYYYLRTNLEKIEVLEPITTLIKVFLDNVNSFLDGKKIRFNVSNGFSIESEYGRIVSFDYLSSGEIQVLILLFSTLKTNIDGSANLIIIDEPEISLNTTWQRRLIQSLTNISAVSPVQFIVATHSSEMIYEQFDYVVDLNKA
jgi:predicted ATPase